MREVVCALCTKVGQLCTNTCQVLVQHEVHDDFAAAVAAKMVKFVTDDPAEEAARVGPLIRKAQRVEDEVQVAAKSCAVCAT